MIQLQFLNYLLKTKDSSILLVNNLNEDFFSDYKNEYNFIINHLREYGNIPDSITFLNNFPSFDIIEVSESPDFLIDKLYEDKNTRVLASIFNKIKKHLMEGDIDKAMELYTSSTDFVLKAKHIDAVDILTNTDELDMYFTK